MANTNTTLVAELNRLANGGVTYPPVGQFLEAAGAATKWAAGALGVQPSDNELVAALNLKAGNTVGNFRDLAGVCNQLAGTSGLTDVDALSRVAA